jgi:polar amino acid transport system ATP-binding protein
MSIETSPKISLQDVHKSFGQRHVLNGINLEINQSEVIAFIGSSGSGKSTLLRCINLLESIDDGAILLDGVDISEPGLNPDPFRRRIGMVFQNFNLFPHMTVIDNIALAPRKVLGRADGYPDQLSGGQQQRVAIARSLAMNPEVMLLDEITSALDPELVGEVLDVVRELKSNGMTMLLATHEMGFAREISDRVCFLHQGQVLECAPPAEFFSQPKHERTQQFLQRVTDAGRL